MPRLTDLSGMRFGWLTVVHREHAAQSKSVLWRCLCDCGNEVVVSGGNLRSGHTKSCGCYRERVRPTLHKVHGLCRTRLYRIYHSMKKRCYNPNSQFYHRYGGRGIDICEEWLNDFTAFYAWALENGYAEGLSIDRIDNDKGYSPQNCRWVDGSTQRRNRADIREISYDGEKMCLSDAAAAAGLSDSAVRARVDRYGWSVEKALTTPLKGANNGTK